MCVCKINLYVNIGIVFRVLWINFCKGFKFFFDVVMLYKIEKKFENVLNIIFFEKNYGVRVLLYNKGLYFVCKL